MANTKVKQDSTVRIWVEWRTHPRPGDTNPDARKGILVDPDSQTWYIKDPAGITKATVTDQTYIVKDSVGTYFFDADTSASAMIGTWKAVCYATIAGTQEVKVVEFDVVAQ